MSRAARERTDLGVLFLRAWVGLNFVFSHGWGKIADPDAFLSGPGMAEFPMPEVLGWGAMLAEVAGGALILAGLFTRAAAAALLGVMMGAALVVHAEDPWVKKEFALTYAAILVFLLAHGAGRWSLDARRARKRKEW